MFLNFYHFYYWCLINVLYHQHNFQYRQVTKKLIIIYNGLFIYSFIFVTERTTYTISTTTRLFNQTICTCLLEELNNFESLFCPAGYKFNIINAYLFDSVDQVINEEQCQSKPDTRLPLRSDLFNFLQNYCNESICNLSGALLLGFLDSNINSSCISADIIWNCYKPIGKYLIYFFSQFFLSLFFIQGNLFYFYSDSSCYFFFL